jgi:hypothetical protein
MDPRWWPELPIVVASSFVIGWVWAGLGFWLRVLLRSARQIPRANRFFAPHLWPWRSGLSGYALLAAAPTGLAFFTSAIIDAHPVGLGLIAGVLAFLCVYGTCASLMFSMDAAQEFITAVGPHVLLIARLGLGFLATFATVVFVFAMLFHSVYEADRFAFSDAPSPELAFGELLYFSLMTITTASSSVQPVSGLAKWLVAAEVVMGVLLLVGIVGVFFAGAAPTFSPHGRPEATTLSATQSAASQSSGGDHPTLPKPSLDDQVGAVSAGAPVNTSIRDSETGPT